MKQIKSIAQKAFFSKYLLIAALVCSNICLPVFKSNAASFFDNNFKTELVYSPVRKSANAIFFLKTSPLKKPNAAIFFYSGKSNTYALRSSNILTTVQLHQSLASIYYRKITGRFLQPKIFSYSSDADIFSSPVG